MSRHPPAECHHTAHAHSKRLVRREKEALNSTAAVTSRTQLRCIAHCNCFAPAEAFNCSLGIGRFAPSTSLRCPMVSSSPSLLSLVVVTSLLFYRVPFSTGQNDHNIITFIFIWILPVLTGEFACRTSSCWCWWSRERKTNALSPASRGAGAFN